MCPCAIQLRKLVAEGEIFPGGIAVCWFRRNGKKIIFTGNK